MTGSGVADADMGASPSGGESATRFREPSRLPAWQDPRSYDAPLAYVATWRHREPPPPRVAQVTKGDAARDRMSEAERYRRALVCGLDWPPTKRTCSLPLSTSGVIAQVPPQAVVATFP